MLSKSELKELKSLHQKKHREKRAEFLVEGDKSVREAIRSKAKIECIFPISSWSGISDYAESGYRMELIDEKQLKALSELKNPKEVVALVKMPDPSSEAINWASTWNIYLEGVRDPGNLGTILRIADWYGLDQILCSPDCVEVYNQKVIQSSMGAVFRIPARILSLPELAEQTKSSGTQLSAALLEGKDIRHSKPDASGVIMMGNESKGLSPEAIALCDQRLTIARIGEAESLNVAIATGIFAQWFSSN